MRPNMRLQDTLERLRISAGWEGPLASHRWFDLLGVSRRRYGAFLSGRQPLDDGALSRLCDHFGIDEQDLAGGRVDFRAVAAKLARKGNSLPKAYLKGAHGKMRTTMYSFDYLEHVGGWKLRADAMRRLRVSEAAITDPMAPVSIQLITDLCELLLRSEGFLDDEFNDMGAYAFRANLKTPLGLEFAACRSVADTFVRFVRELMSFFEANCDYLLEDVSNEGCRIIVEENRDIAEDIGVRHLGSPLVCELKGGFFSAISHAIGAPSSSIYETECVHQGARRCVYQVRFPQEPLGRISRRLPIRLPA